jgi:hypothetical protein
LEDAYFLNILRPNPATPTKPEPSSISVAGSGTGEGSLEVGFVSELTTVVELKFDLLAVPVGSSEGQPIIPNNIIHTHKTINNFFTVPPVFIKIQTYFLKSNVKRKFISCPYKTIYYVCQALNNTIYGIKNIGY